MNQRILFVDDEQNLLSGYKRTFKREFEVDTAHSGQLGILKLKETGPYAVIVSDMRMPEMDGVEFLAHAKEIAPDSTRIMLTGNNDLETAMKAVNEGNIFRFLTKPCPSEHLRNTLLAAMEQYRLVMAEKELLEKTLRGSVEALIEVLSISNPSAFSRASHLREYVKHMTGRLNIKDAWQYEIAAMLSQIGCISLSTEVIEKVYSNKQLNKDEANMYLAHPEVGVKLLEKIPRLETIVDMIKKQQFRFVDFDRDTPPNYTPPDILGAQLLKIAVDFDYEMSKGKSCHNILQEMKINEGEYNPVLLGTLQYLELARDIYKQIDVRVLELESGMIAAEHIRASNGMLLLNKDQTITPTLISRLRNFRRQIGVIEPLKVYIRH